MAPSQRQQLDRPRLTPRPRTARAGTKATSALEEQRLASAQWRTLTILAAAAALCALLQQMQ